MLDQFHGLDYLGNLCYFAVMVMCVMHVIAIIMPSSIIIVNFTTL